MISSSVGPRYAGSSVHSCSTGASSSLTGGYINHGVSISAATIFGVCTLIGGSIISGISYTSSIGISSSFGGSTMIIGYDISSLCDICVDASSLFISIDTSVIEFKSDTA